MQDAMHRRFRDRGFTLVEALVALVVLSIGLLGVAALQFTSLKANHGSATRTQAVYLAYDIIDRMRTNPTAASAGEYQLGFGDTPSGTTIAKKDLISWRQNIANALPGGSVAPTGSVNVDAVSHVITVSIKWDDSHAEQSTSAANVVTFTVVTQISN